MGDIMNLQINCTPDGIITYPMHRHNNYEIMFYLEGTGYLRTQSTNYPFLPGSIIIVPPGTEHGSISKNGFKNISVSGNFENTLHFKDTVTLFDNAQNEGKLLAEMLYNNRHKNNDFLSKLCLAYIHFILQFTTVTDSIIVSTNKIINEIADNFCDYNINLSHILQKSGYAEDYIRAKFKKITGKTPNAFLTELRIKHATFLIEIYANTFSLQQIAERCGYTDYIYFSKKFKVVMGMSPSEYKKMHLNAAIEKI
ncbi:MAG: helix-turn-helix transcriptional regulator [Clostridia bacterium]|nr:helix-turn-helix transcriptional regulator [Clostridia bacterium]